jgi:hypothetical protein
MLETSDAAEANISGAATTYDIAASSRAPPNREQVRESDELDEHQDHMRLTTQYFSVLPKFYPRPIQGESLIQAIRRVRTHNAETLRPSLTKLSNRELRRRRRLPDNA